jgi:hypothetical protein
LHTPGPLEASTEKTSGLPEAPPVADNVAELPTTPEAVAVKLIVWVAGRLATTPSSLLE